MKAKLILSLLAVLAFAVSVDAGQYREVHKTVIRGGSACVCGPNCNCGDSCPCKIAASKSTVVSQSESKTVVTRHRVRVGR